MDFTHCLCFAPLAGPPDERFLIERPELHTHIRGQGHCGCQFCLHQLRHVHPKAAAEAYFGDEPMRSERERLVQGAQEIIRDPQSPSEDKMDFLIAGYLAERQSWLRKHIANTNRAPGT